jgi:hypothetical protein
MTWMVNSLASGSTAELTSCRCIANIRQCLRRILNVRQTPDHDEATREHKRPRKRPTKTEHSERQRALYEIVADQKPASSKTPSHCAITVIRRQVRRSLILALL